MNPKNNIFHQIISIFPSFCINFHPKHASLTPGPMSSADQIFQAKVGISVR